MTRKQQFVQNFLVGLFGTTAFVTITVFSLLWVNGLSYDRATGSFEQTSVIAVEEKLRDVTVKLNGLTVAEELPLQQRNLKPGLYELEISRVGYRSFIKNVILQVSEVKIIENVVLIANNPLITELPADYRFITLGPISAGLTLSDGELYDGGRFITRFATAPSAIYRLNHIYLYRLDGQIRSFDPETSQDFLIVTLENEQTTINPKPFSWSFAVQDGARNYLVNLTEPTVAAVDLPQ
ncbi:MAG: hypothetical protein WEC83_00260 [Patescibacteria group bacterium]